ncbi:purine-binding chemotaxis protein CheW [Pseudomonas lalucatii]|uniref:Purine-binding chemotaxis protein CheW n=1 Tax=Pseudomonas lalucatii TaxID=1424203 RepID=A0ABS5PVT4_9PSED|nr:chemotaxis protein CheW [Pseudomonas lalucatii]MBS7660635.1 purine-binding chemotaxis protein CheW [Pseudomonas lalucatii]QVM87462.1 purine-binding chemotaxis protein CheW [Pseudomonas lalucatii]
MSEPLKEDQGWTQIRQRLAQFERRLAEGFGIDADERDARVLARSRQWARQEEEERAEDWLEVLMFSLSGELYAIGSEHVAEVLPLAQYTPLPGTPPHVLGIVSVRGHIVSLLDLRVLFDLPLGGLSDKNFVAILRSTEMEFGLLLDRVQGMARIRRDAVQEKLANLGGVRASYLLGVTTEQRTVLDGARMLNDPSLRVMDEE